MIKVFIHEDIFASNSYLICKDNHCLLIDCGYLSNEMIIEINKYAFFDGVILTHKHFDHIRGLDHLIELYPNINIYSYLNNDDFCHDVKLNCANMFNEVVIFSNQITSLTKNIKVGIFDLKIHHTPGHTSDSVIVEYDDNLFTGDTIFAHAVGRVDLPTSSLLDMKNSLLVVKELIKSNYNIYPGHGKICNSEYLKKFNMYIR